MDDQYYYKVTHKHFGLLLVTPNVSAIKSLLAERSGESRATIAYRLGDIKQGTNDYGSITIYKYKED